MQPLCSTLGTALQLLSCLRTRAQACADCASLVWSCELQVLCTPSTMDEAPSRPIQGSLQGSHEKAAHLS